MKQIPLPAEGENLIIWSAKYGRDAIELLNLMSLMEVNLVPFSSSRGKYSLSVSDQNAVLGIPLKWNAKIADPATSTAANTAAIISILNMFRSMGVLPS